ncbi:MAG: hypothetical protein AB7E32_16910 [Desulfovibrio sp.]
MPEPAQDHLERALAELRLAQQAGLRPKADRYAALAELWLGWTLEEAARRFVPRGHGNFRPLEHERGCPAD